MHSSRSLHCTWPGSVMRSVWESRRSLEGITIVSQACGCQDLGHPPGGCGLSQNQDVRGSEGLWEKVSFPTISHLLPHHLLEPQLLAGHCTVWTRTDVASALGKLVTQKVRKPVLQLVDCWVRMRWERRWVQVEMPALSSLEGPAGLAPGLSSLQRAAQVPGTYKSRILSSEFLSRAPFGSWVLLSS